MKTAFNPTWTVGASGFLRCALRDLGGDGCANDIDQHAADRYAQIGSVWNLNCQASRSSRFGDESTHSDTDGLASCEDDDDDGDGISDEVDPCSLDEGELCISFGTTCPGNPAFFDCGPGGC